MSESEAGVPAEQETPDAFEEVLAKCPEKIRNSPNAGWYVDALRSGWSTRRVSKYGKEHFGESISHVLFSRLKRILPSKLEIQDTLKDEYLGGLDAVVNSMQDLPDAIQIQRMRLKLALDYEKRMGQTAILPAFMKPAREEMVLFWSMSKDYASFVQHLNLLKGGNGGSQREEVPTKDSLVKSIINGMSDEDQVKMLEMLEKQEEKDNAVIDGTVVGGKTETDVSPT